MCHYDGISGALHGRSPILGNSSLWTDNVHGRVLLWRGHVRWSILQPHFVIRLRDVVLSAALARSLLMVLFDCMARLDPLVLFSVLARSYRMVLSWWVARSRILVLLVSMARSQNVVLSRYVARSIILVLFSDLARSFGSLASFGTLIGSGSLLTLVLSLCVARSHLMALS
jgi:hypothetical protein